MLNKLRKTLRSSIDKDGDQKVSVTFTISPSSQLTSRLDKNSDLEADVTARINVLLIPSTTKNNADANDRLKKTDQQQSPPIPQPRSLFDIDNARID
jgi:hypothetical protein